MLRATTTLLVTLSMAAPQFAVPAKAQETKALGELVEEAEAEKVDLELPEEVELLTEDELDELVAPVALYPDALLAQVLVAATFPLQIVKADRLLADSEGMSDTELKDAISQQEWDPSVLVLLSGFPTVVQRMSDDLEWTDRLGNAMVQQDDDVLDAVQRMRAQAKETGYLTTNAAQTVEEDDGHIYIAPTDPKVIYVPTYDTQTVYTQAPTAQPYIQPYNQTYTQPYVQPQSSNILTNPLVAGALGFGGAMLVQELWGNNDDDDNDDGWDDYWVRRRPIDYNNRVFYPRPRPYAPAYTWSRERDLYWNRNDWAWRRDAIAQKRWEEDRRAASHWVVNPVTGTPQLARMRDRVRLTPAAERNRIAIDRKEEALKREQERRRQLARQENRLEAEKEARQQAKVRAERQEAREKAERQEIRAKEEKQAEREKAARQEERARAERQAEREKAARQEERAKAERQAEREKAEKRAEREKAAKQEARAKAEKQAEREKAAKQEERARQQRQEERAAQERAAQRKAAEQKKAQQAKKKKVCADDDRKCKQAQQQK